jgi:hypothetical protein
MSSDEEMDATHARREALARRLCAAMGWEYKTGPAFAGIRAVALGKAVALGVDKLEEILKRLEGGR